MKTLFLKLFFIVGVFLLSSCGKTKKARFPNISNEKQERPEGDSKRLPESLLTCKYRFEKASQESQWENLTKFIGIWISTSDRLTEKRDGNQTVYTKRGFNIESEISFRPIVFMYSDPNGKNLISIKAEPDHFIQMSARKLNDYFTIQTFQDLRPKREKCKTFGIKLLKGDNFLEVLGPELGDTLSDPENIESFFENNPTKERFAIFESRDI